MAGYFRKLAGHVYDGAHVASVALTNGLFVTINDNGAVALSAADADTTFRCVEKTDLWGLKALVLDVLTIGGEVYMVENDIDVNDNEEYDEAQYEIKAGELVKMKQPLPGEQIVLSVSDEIYAAASVNAKYAVAANGLIAVVAQSTEDE